MQYSIRKATSDDMSSVLKLIQELASFEKKPDAVTIDETYLKIHGFSKKPAFIAFVAEINNKIVGMVLGYERFSTWKGKSMHLEDLIVQENKRGLGIGKALYTTFLKYAYQQNAQRVEWAVLDWNKNAVDFYKKTGATVFTDWQIVQMDYKTLTQFVNSNSNE